MKERKKKWLVKARLFSALRKNEQTPVILNVRIVRNVRAAILVTK